MDSHYPAFNGFQETFVGLFYNFSTKLPPDTEWNNCSKEGNECVATFYIAMAIIDLQKSKLPSPFSQLWILLFKPNSSECGNTGPFGCIGNGYANGTAALKSNRYRLAMWENKMVFSIALLLLFTSLLWRRKENPL